MTAQVTRTDDDRRGGPAGMRALGRSLGDDQSAHQGVGGDAALGDGPLVDRGEGAGDARAQPAPDGVPQRAGQPPVQQGGGAVAVGDPDEQQAAWPQRAGQPVQDQLDMRDPLKQPPAVHDVEPAQRQRYGAQVPDEHLVVSAACLAEYLPGERVIAIDYRYRDIEAAFFQFAEAKLAQWRQAARLQDADWAPQPGEHVVAQRLGEEPPCARPRAGRAIPDGRHDTDSSGIITSG